MSSTAELSSPSSANTALTRSVVDPDYTLDHKYARVEGRIYLSGVQALVRLPLMQRLRLRAERQHHADHGLERGHLAVEAVERVAGGVGHVGNSRGAARREAPTMCETHTCCNADGDPRSMRSARSRR